jgi:predicted Rossmann-fold nucleotide-binding protein
LDELCEVWTTGMLALHHKPIALLDVDGFYAGLLSWLGGLASTAFVRPAAMELLIVTDSLPDAFDAIEARLAGQGGTPA